MLFSLEAVRVEAGASAGERAHEGEHATFGGGVRGHVGDWCTRKRSGRSEEHERSTCGSNEWEERARGERGGGKVERELLLPHRGSAVGNARHREPSGEV